MATNRASRFTAEGTRYPIPALYGPRTVTVNETIDPSVTATSLTTDDDIYLLIPLPFGKGRILDLNVQFVGELDSGSSLDLDVVLVDDEGTTTLYDSSAQSNQLGRADYSEASIPLYQQFVTASSTTLSGVGFKAITAPATDASGEVNLSITYEQTSE